VKKLTIPRKIHYCWFGGAKLPKKVQRCMESWKKYCPEFEIVRWDEGNAPLEDNVYVRQAYQLQKWAFASDYVRLTALCEQGGIYLDTDVELLRPPDAFLIHKGCMGFESKEKVGTSFIAAEAQHPFLCEIWEQYQKLSFLNTDNVLDCTTNVERVTKLLLKKGLRPDGTFQTVCEMTIYPQDFFSCKNLETGRIFLTERSCAVHHFQASWMSPRQKLHTKIAQWIGPANVRRARRLLGKN